MAPELVEGGDRGRQDRLAPLRQVVLISGGFDPIHVGHIRLIQSCARVAPVWVALNSNEWLKRKKGYVFMPWRDRAEILNAIQGVENVVMIRDEDGSVCDAIKAVRPRYFANGGDRYMASADRREVDLCDRMGIGLLYNMGGGKAASSSRLVEAACDALRGAAR